MSGAPLARAGLQVAGATVVVSLVSYGYGIVLAHLLDGAQYAVFAAGQTMLLLAGTASAAIPWALAKAVRVHPPGSPQRRSAMAHSVALSLVGALVVALVLGGISAVYAPVPAVLATAAAVAAVVLPGTAIGWLQGELRFARLAVLRVAEVVVRVALGAAAVVAGFGAAGALGAFVVGSAVLLVGGLTARAFRDGVPRTAGGTQDGDLGPTGTAGPAWRDLRWRPGLLGDRSRWRETAGLTRAQALLGVFTATDIVLAPVLAGADTDTAGFQLASTLGRAPLYVATALAVVLYPRLAGPDRRDALRSALSAYGWLGLPAAAVLVTAPADVLGLVVPAHLSGVGGLVVATAVAGLGYGVVTLVATVHQARGAFGQVTAMLSVAIGLLVAGLAAGWFLGGVPGLAVGTALGSVAAAVVAVRTEPLPVPVGAVLATLVALPLLWLARAWTPAWAVLVVALGLFALWRLRSGRPQPAPGERLRVLHLGFEDPALPGSGGGAVRTHEMNRRLARNHDITVLTTRWPGCVDRVEDGVRYLHVGVGSGRTYLGRIAGYAVALPFVSRRHRADLVVEDFFAPISTMAAPLWTNRPTLGMVQWLNAREKARQYKLPFHLVERAGVRTHRRMVAVSDGIAQELRRINRTARVDVVGNGVDARAFDVREPRGRDVVFVGRLEIAQKGLDLLVTAFAARAGDLPGDLVLAGTGPDEERLRALAARAGIADRVRFAGWVAGVDKYRLFAGAAVVAVPSRFETFGMVAVEAAAAGSPVVAFDIDCLREVVPEAVGVRVPCFDTDALGAALVSLALDPERADRLGAAGREFARAYSWDWLAERQEESYLSAIREWSADAAHGGR
ncbi:glycosyltransferase [Actinokineospora sp. PR83]|uniref:glycosyltransferase n=1 Tax=Actinokineospora sp. PR83 TaxID=2884908 RepID=UPI0027DF777F|nr:glycosyltransferase [Actinokineospora sp. PR83]MCG8920184.1 glycosyltransferase [Actinokineospora sp. PR83]